jgi:rhodanese-related sulfurtransferase
MYRPLLLLCVLLVLFPRANVHAILPPDLVVSVGQSIVGIIGLIIASVTLALASIKNYLLMLLPTLKHKVVFGVLLVGVLGAVVGVTFFLEEEKQLAQWQAGVDSEIRSAWSQYESVYSAADEKSARATMQGMAEEVTWQEFKSLARGTDYLILDIRDSYAYQVGYFPGSVHMRLADLLHGRWTELEDFKDKPILLICFLGTTGTIASDFLSAQGFTNLYIPQGGLQETLRRESVPFVGTSRFAHHEEMIDRLSVDEANALVGAGAKVIDVRSPEMYTEASPVTPDVQFFREFKTTVQIEEFVSKLQKDTTYLSVCNSDASCYQAEMLLHDLKANGLNAGGTFDVNKPQGLKW